MASKTYVSAVPLTMVRLSEGGYQNVLEGDPIAGEAVDEQDLKRLVRKRFLVEAKQAEKADTGSDNPDTVDAVLADVGEDKEKAQAALDAENAKDKPRSSLVGKLESILGKA